MKDNDEFCEQIRRHQKAMYSLAHSIVGNEHDANDVIGEAILKAFCNLDTLRSDKAFKTWILRIVHNTAIQLLRKRKDTADIDEQVDTKVIAECDITTKLVLRSAVESLKQPYRTVVMLYYYENLSVSQIAQITGSSALSIRQQLTRARQQLRQILNKEDFLYE